MSMPRRRHPDPRRLAALAVLVLVVSGLVALTNPTASAAVDPCGPSGNEIACENSLPGVDPSVWDSQWGAGAESIQGFATDISVDVGSRIDFKVDTDASDYAITVYRLGYYGGSGARQIATVTPSAALPQRQPNCITDVATELYDCGNWAVSASWNVPSTAVSGVYIARLVRTDNGDSSHITFVVRDDSSRSELVFQTSDPTWQAYNDYGGSSFYHGAGNGRAHKVSYNRPVLTRNVVGGRDFFMANEYPMVRFLEKNGYDVSYLAGVDTDRRGALLRNHETFLSVGHDEYWSGAQRANVEAARDAGVNLMFLSGNDGYWRTRYEPSADAGRTPYRTLVSYKETWSNGKIDPTPEWTGTWRDPRFAARSQGGGRPENALIGTMYTSNYSDLPVTVSAAEGRLRLWRNTDLASMTSGSTQLAAHTVGYESNEDVDNGERPPGLIRLSTTTGAVPEYLQDFGNTVSPGTTTHHLTMYRAASGALVFSAGSVQWSWGLDPVHDSPYGPAPADRRMQQAQVNLLADMDAQPTTLSADLQAATKSADATGPTVAISTPAAGATRPNGATATVTGTATDAGGGQVAGVEVSTDDGATWHPATGTTSWTYTHTQQGAGSTTIRARAIDDSANIGATATRAVDVTCPCSILGPQVPQTPAFADPGAAEFGLRFSPDVDGFVTGVRFYKGTGNTGSHVGSLWSDTGQRLASVTFGNESATGWQTASFTSPVAVAAGQTYVVSYSAPNGHYSGTLDAFYARPLEAAPFTVAGGYGAAPAGVFGGLGTFPTQSFRNANYFVDPVFSLTDDSPLTVTDQWPLPGSTSVAPGTTVRARFSKPVTAATVGVTLKDSLGATVPGATAYDAATRTVTFTPSSPLAGFVRHTVTATAKDTTGNPVSAGGVWSFTSARPQAAPGVCPCSVYSDEATPTVLEGADSDPVTLGMRFSTDKPGTVTGIRFYKGPGNTGTHTGALWSASGQQLAQGTFTDESTSGWQTLVLDEPVAVAAGTDYVVSYRTTVGRYSLTPGAFSAADLSRGPLRVTSTAGAYTYGTGFPSTTTSTSYLVDVVFEKQAPTVSVVAQDPPAGAVDVARDSSVRVWLSTPVRAGATLAADAQGATIPGTVSLSADATVLRWVPEAPMPAGAVVRMTLGDVVSAEGAALPTQVWTFETRDADAAPVQTLFGDTAPAVAGGAESSPIEVGTAFTPTRDGTVRALRFHKGPGNDGTHVGSLWTSAGQLLARATFTNETPNGWQTVRLATPVRVGAGQTYVVSYLAPQGHYSYTPGLFSSPLTAGQLTAPAGDNGRYLYGAAGGLPLYSWNSTGYFADVEFVPDPASIAVAGRSPAPGATDVPLGARPSVTVTAPLADGATMEVRDGSSTVSGTVALASDRLRLTFVPDAELPAGADLTVEVGNARSTEGAALADQSWSFRTEAARPGTTSTSMFPALTPATPAVADGAAVELGTAFTPSVAGSATAIRFYKGSGNTGTHVGSLWSSTGTRLASVTFEGESATGWQTMALDAPVPLTAGATYVVSYYAPDGRYSVTGGFFGNGWSAGPLSAPATGNGRYRYGAGGGFPTGSWNASNYFVDVVFRPAAP